MTDMNKAQRLLCEKYAQGEFDHLKDCASSEDFVAQAVAEGDGLFAYLARELSDKEGCEGLEEALDRVRKSARQVEEVAGEIEAAMDAEAAPAA